MDIRPSILERLSAAQDKNYAVFQAGLIPNVSLEKIIGVRIPVLRSISKSIFKECKSGSISEFLDSLPHYYYEENLVHAFLIEQLKDFGECTARLQQFLPYVDNWAVCDCMSPKILAKFPERLLTYIQSWMNSGETYTVRFATGMLMRYFLDDNFKEEYLQQVADISSEEYYVNMMRAWFFATALAKQYESTIPYLENRRMDAFTHKKAIQKALESYRIPTDIKDYLRKLR